jgi:hypothetical protein
MSSSGVKYYVQVAILALQQALSLGNPGAVSGGRNPSIPCKYYLTHAPRLQPRS